MSETTSPSFFEKIFADLLSIFKKGETVIVSLEHDIARFADTVTNFLKTNPTAVTTLDSLIAIAEGINPALKPWVDGLELEIPRILNLVSNNAVVLSEPVEKQASDFLTYLENIKGVNGTVYAGIMATLNPAIQKFIIANSNTIVLPPDAQLIAAGQAVHANG